MAINSKDIDILQKKAAFDFFNDFFRKVTEGRSDYELIAQEILG